MQGKSFETFRYLMNVVVYLTHPDADKRLCDASPEYEALRDRMLKAQGAKREKVKARLRGMTPAPRILLGGNLYCGNRLRGEAPEHATNTGRKQKVRGLVSGHWRMVPCGTGKLERRLKWIEPFWRGPESVPLTAERNRVVKL
jgi:hypothetical protein